MRTDLFAATCFAVSGAFGAVFPLPALTGASSCISATVRRRCLFLDLLAVPVRQSVPTGNRRPPRHFGFVRPFAVQRFLQHVPRIPGRGPPRMAKAESRRRAKRPIKSSTRCANAAQSPQNQTCAADPFTV